MLHDILAGIEGIPYNVFDRRDIITLATVCAILGIVALVAGYLLGH